MNKINQLHESNQYEDSAFPFGMYTVTKEHITPIGRGYRDLHWHEELQFTLVISGEVSMQIYDQTYVVKKGEAIFINRGLLHMVKDITDDGEYISFNFLEKMLGFFAGSRIEQKCVIPYTSNIGLTAIHLTNNIDWQSEMIAHLLQLQILTKKSAFETKEYQIALTISTLWLKMIENIKTRIISPNPSWIKKQKRLQTFIVFIHNHYQEDIRLENVASSAYVSVGECGRCFKSVLNITPHEYLLNYRISKSIELLNETDHSITEIATNVGFNHVSYFIQHFKKRTGKTPNKYRKG